MRLGVGPVNLILEVNLQETAMLLFLIGLTVASFLLMRRMRRDRVTKLGNFQTLKEVHNSYSIGSPVILGAKILIVCMLFLTATESLQVERQQVVTDVNYVLVLDASQSMTIPDYRPDRLGYTKNLLDQWVSDLPFKAEMSVISFDREPEIHTLPTKDPGEVREGLSSVEVNLSESGTDLSGALNESLRFGEGNTRVLVFTDGSDIRYEEIEESVGVVSNRSSRFYFFRLPQNNRTRQIYRQLNLSLAEANIEGNFIEQDRGPELRNLAEISGGDFYRVSDDNFFQAALQDTTTQEEKLGINSSLYILLFISFFVIFEMLLYSKYGAL